MKSSLYTNKKSLMNVIFFILLINIFSKIVISTDIDSEQILKASPKQETLSFLMTSTNEKENWENDPNSFSNTKSFQINHMKLNLKTDFDKKILKGNVIHEVLIIDKSSLRLTLDTRGLNIIDVSLINDDNKEVKLKFNLGENHSVYGRALNIDLTDEIIQKKKINIKINYETTPECSACQWLEPSQTEGKKHPYFYTQCEAIHARSIVPCQDSPIIKQTYESEITVPENLRALMSAVLANEGKSENGYITYKFEQKMRIPSYLLAIAVGNLKGIKIGPRTTVWSEPNVVEKAAEEFTSTEEFIKIGENYLTEYSWGVYDLLVLPPSFPFGGMENPCLTFVTPTIVAGDKSLVDVVAHEIAHSWTGNLVTNSNWQHFWLNEGYTVYIERKIISKLHGEEYRQFSSIIGWNDLKDSVNNYGKEKEFFTALVPDLRNQDPDDSFSSVPYEKGYNLLYYLEKILGGSEVFDPYVREYVKEFSNKSLNTNEWLKYLYDYFRKVDKSKIEILDSVDWDTWFYGYGMPPVDQKFDRSLLNKCDDLAKRWINLKDKKTFDGGFTPEDLEKFDAKQKMIFLLRIMDDGPYSKEFIEAMDKVYGLTKVANSEIRFLWQSICLTSNYEPIFNEVVKFVEEQGRMKFVTPLYRMLYKCKNGSELAISTFKKNKSFYHPIAVENISRELGLKK